MHGRDELPLKILLEQHGVAVLDEPAQLAQRLGVRVAENHSVQVKTVLRGGAAEQAGFSAGDEWLGLELIGKPVSSKTARRPDAGWRLGKLDDLLLYAGNATKVMALVARDKRLLRLELTLPPAITTWRLAVEKEARVNEWLDPSGKSA